MNNKALIILAAFLIGIVIFVADVLAREFVEKKQKQKESSESSMQIERVRDILIYSKLSITEALDLLLLNNKGWKVVAIRKYPLESCERVDVYHAGVKILIKGIAMDIFKMSQEITKPKEENR